MKKKLLVALLSLACILAGAIGFAACDFGGGGGGGGTKGLEYMRYTEKDGTECYYVAKGTATAKDIVIPATYKGLPVIGIMDRGFAYGEHEFPSSEEITTVTLPEGMKRIEYGAFERCYNLTSINLPSSLTEIGDEAFSCCFNLAEINLPNGLTSIQFGTFLGCRSLKNVTIPNSVTQIGEMAFEGCESLESATIPNSVKGIGERAFSGCDSLASVNIPNDIKAIQGRTFEACYALTDIAIPDSVTSIGYQAFRECNSLASITIPDSVIQIGESAFESCDELKDVTIGKGVNYVPDNSINSLYSSGAFFECPIERASVPANACNAIKNANLKELTITYGTQQDFRNSNPRISFRGCTALSSVTIGEEASIPEECDIFKGCSIKTAHVPTSAIGIIPKEALETVFVTGGERIDDLAFFRSSALTDLTICDGVTAIGERTFYDCRKLKTVTIADSVKNIGRDAFLNCNISTATIPSVAAPYIKGTSSGYSNSSLKTVVITSGTTIGGLDSCKNLTSVTLPEGITSISSNAFAGCKFLTEINLPKSVTSISDYAFDECNSLQKIEIPKSVTRIGYRAFFNCFQMTGITIPENVTEIGDSAFEYCFKLVEVYNLSRIDIKKGAEKNGFAGCYALSIYTSAATPSKISTTADGYMFYDDGETVCLLGYSGTEKELVLPENLNGKNYEIWNHALHQVNPEIITPDYSFRKVTIPDTVTKIGDSVFNECRNLETVVMGNGVEIIGDKAFYGTSLKNITLSNKVKSIGEWAFHNVGIKSITLPDTLTKIGYAAFNECMLLKNVNYGGTKEQWNAIEKEWWDGHMGSGIGGTQKDYVITCSDGTISSDEIES